MQQPTAEKNWKVGKEKMGGIDVTKSKGQMGRCFWPTQVHKPLCHLVPLGNCKANMGGTGICLRRVLRVLRTEGGR